MKHKHRGYYKSRTPNGFIIYKKRPLHTHSLTKENRSIFQNLDKKNYEVGGYMDFNQKGLERADVYIGDEASVDIDMTPDKEVEYHTHPKHARKDIDKANYFPTIDDVDSFELSPAQAMIIFHNGKATISKKMKNFRFMPTVLNKIEQGIKKDSKSMPAEKMFEKYTPKYKKAGLEVTIVPEKQAINLPIKIVEPAVKQRHFDWSAIIGDASNKAKLKRQVDELKDNSDDGQLNLMQAQKLAYLNKRIYSQRK